MKKFFLLSFFLLSWANATDEGDFLIHGVGGWNQDLRLGQGRGELAYAFWNDFSIGPVVEFNKLFVAYGMGITWHLEPFEVMAHAGPLFWNDKIANDKRESFHISVHANYLFQIRTHLQLLVSAGVNLPDKYFRGVPLGAGFRYWF